MGPARLHAGGHPGVVLPLILTHQPPVVLSSAFVLLPVAMLVEAQARHLRDDRERPARTEHRRSAMVSTLAHDVRSPLTTVQLAPEELRNQADGPAERMLDGAIRQTSRIARPAEGLLDLHRIESSGHLKLDRRLIPASRLLQDALSYVRSTEVTSETDDDLLVHVDGQRFEQILSNLVSNALRYGRPAADPRPHRP
ncbi:sensor histidine kinase [Micromonosporaceae bacterium Da 78-11]